MCIVMQCVTIVNFPLLGKTLPHDNTSLTVAGVTDGSRIMILGKKVHKHNPLFYLVTMVTV